MYVKEIVRLKDDVNSMSSQSALAYSGADLDKLKSEIIAEKMSHLVALTEKDKKIWQLQKDQDEKRLSLNGKDGEISALKAPYRLCNMNLT